MQNNTIDNRDSADLKKFGYQQELKRSLGGFSAFAAGFSYISILTGLFQMFYLGFGAAGPAFFWSWPIVFVGHLLIALCFAEVSAHYPLSGGVYQWSKYLGSPFMGWMTGWIYFACLVVTLAAVALAMQNSLPQIWGVFQFVKMSNEAESYAINAVLLGCFFLTVSTFMNCAGVKLISIINNVGVFAELIGLGVLIISLAHHSVRDPLAATSETLFKGHGQRLGYLGPFLAGTALTASYVMYGYDTAGSLAEETQNPRYTAPRAILRAFIAAAVAGFFVLLFALMATPDLTNSALSSPNGGLPYIVTSVLGGPAGKGLLCIVVFAVFVCILAVHTGGVRIVFAMARDGLFPFAQLLTRVSKRSQIPVIPTVFVGLAALVILMFNVKFPKIVELVTAVSILWANLAYLMVIAALLHKRLQGWPQGEELQEGRKSFSLGKWGIPVNLLALLWSIFMVINVGWPRSEILGEEGYQKYSPIFYTFILLASGALYYGFRRYFYLQFGGFFTAER